MELRQIAAEHIVATGNGDGRWTDVYVTPYADAQATIAALQARVQELEQAAKETHGRFISEQAAKKDVIDELTVALKSDADGQVLIDKLMQDVLKLESQLTQRTAELEALRKWRDYVTVALQRPGGAFFEDAGRGREAG